ncbi:MAG TPA: sugar phosphate isomerase/epimerase [Opitutaceae bacterium]|nr:sugar phosphate isomerase/epimerase [Opitutaceae bacterium]
MKLNRLSFLLSLLFVSAFMLVGSARAEVRLGLQTWTCRNMTFDQVVSFADKHGIKYLQFIKNHMDPEAPKEETLRKKAILDQHGLVAYTFGVAGTSMDKEKNRKLFEFAKLMGIKMIIVEPKEQAQWDNLEQLVKEYDIKLAIHNHGKGSVYGDPATIRQILATRDARIGVCMDVGWVTAAGFDAAETFKSYGKRVFDMHFKDKTVQKGDDGKPVTAANGSFVATDTEIGKGDSNYKGLFAEVKKSGWSGVMAIETDSKAFAEDPNRLVTEAKAYFSQMVK